MAVETGSGSPGDNDTDAWDGFSRRAWLASAAVIGLTAVLVAIAYTQLPSQIAIHWNALGQPDLYVSSWLALAFFPAISILTLALFAVAPRLDPLDENIASFRGAYEGLAVSLLLVNAVTALVVVLWNLGYRLGGGQPMVLRASALLMGVLLYASANLLKDVDPNHVVGIRTKWTLADDRVWERTHERAVPAFRVTGVVTAFGAVVPSIVLAATLMAGPLVVVTLYLTYFSYREYHRLN